jgi:hypothetical protein
MIERTTRHHLKTITTENAFGHIADRTARGDPEGTDLGSAPHFIDRLKVTRLIAVFGRSLSIAILLTMLQFQIDWWSTR